jgi:hypothetical protein
MKEKGNISFFPEKVTGEILALEIHSLSGRRRTNKI